MLNTLFDDANPCLKKIYKKLFSVLLSLERCLSLYDICIENGLPN